MKRILFCLQIMLLLAGTPAIAADDDVVINALVDEMNRTKTSLRTGSHPSPYFVSYQVKEIEETELSSCLGAEADIRHSRTRMLTPGIRIGDYNLDSALPSTHSTYAVEQIPIDSDYAALRRVLWLATDRAYTFAITSFEWKKAYLSRVKIPNRLPDLSIEQPAVSIAPLKKLSFDESRWRTTLKRLSNKFREYPSIQASQVSLISRVVTNWIVNSEGTRVRESSSLYGVRMYASTQAPDGMEIKHHDVAVGTEADQLPSDAELEKMVEKFAANVLSMQNARLAEEYCGPVLFKGSAAAAFIGDVLAPNFGLTQEDFADQEKWRNPFKNAIGRRVLPNYMNLVDDPKLQQFGKTSLIGGYNFDDDGVPAERVILVKNGLLNDVCRSRIPTRTSNRSNGHSFGGFGIYNVLQLTSSQTVTEVEMNERIATLAKDAGLDYILVIEKLDECNHLDERPNVNEKTRTFDTPSYSTTPGDPVIAYRLYLDGKKEYVRGLEFNFVSLRAFRDIQAVGQDIAPYVFQPSYLKARHLITPSFLIGELELRPQKPEHSALPVVPGPLTEK